MTLNCEVNINKECTGETAQRCHRKNGLQQTVRSVLLSQKNRAFTDDFTEKTWYMRKQISSRAPVHNRIKRFGQKEYDTGWPGRIFYVNTLFCCTRMVCLVLKLLFIELQKVKCESVSFAWKKATVQKTDKLLKRIRDELPTKLKEKNIRFYVPEKSTAPQFKKLRKKYVRMNMTYAAQADMHPCANRKLLKKTSGLKSGTSIYGCSECDGCTLKETYIRACGSKKLQQNDTKPSICQNVSLNSGKLWKQRIPSQRDSCFW